MGVEVLYHFSEDPAIKHFRPHVPRTNPTHPPAVWAIDSEHAPLYWFPRDCPRVTAWPRNEDERSRFEATFVTVAPRVHADHQAVLEAALQAVGDDQTRHEDLAARHVGGLDGDRVPEGARRDRAAATAATATIADLRPRCLWTCETQATRPPS